MRGVVTVVATGRVKLDFKAHFGGVRMILVYRIWLKKTGIERRGSGRADMRS
jgi:hypothetical protein